MEREILFELLMPLNLGLFATVFFGIYFYEKRLVFMGWLGLGFSCGMIASLLEILHASTSILPLYFDDFSNPLFWSLGTFVTIAMAKRYRRPVPWRLIAALSLAGILGQIWFRHIAPDAKSLAIMVNILAGSLMGLSAIVVFRAANRKMDKIIWIMLGGIAISNFLRVIIIFGILDMPHNFQNYDQSMHVAVLMITSSICAIGGALSMLVLGALDIVDIYRSESTTDPLTKLANRRGFDNHVEKLVAANALIGSNLLLVDLDHFKKINDHYGHITGDAILRSVSDAIKQVTAPFGCAARVGGEEFAILLDSTADRQMAAFFAEQLRCAIQAITHTELNQGERITVSIGTANIREGETFDSAYKRADAALYRAKNAGRNRVVDADSFAPPRPVNGDVAGDVAGDAVGDVNGDVAGDINGAGPSLGVRA